MKEVASKQDKDGQIIDLQKTEQRMPTPPGGVPLEKNGTLNVCYYRGEHLRRRNKKRYKIQTLTQFARTYQLHISRLNVKKKED